MSIEKKILIDELHASARKNFKRRKVIMKGLNECWQIDLIDIQNYAKYNKGYKYILVIIDILSKYAWTIPLKNKTANCITEAFEKLFINVKPPVKIQSDLGGEFHNKLFKNLLNKHNCHLYSTQSVKKASIVERLIRTLKNMLYKTFSMNGNYKWINIIDNIVAKYNSTKHSTIKMCPKDVNEKKANELLNTVYNYKNDVVIKSKRFKMGDYVRISKYKSVFSKGYTPNWSSEIFKIINVQNTQPTTYILEDSKKLPIIGSFYEYEIQKVSNPDVYLVEKVIRKKNNKAYVKWLGMDSTHNSWIDIKNIIK